MFALPFVLDAPATCPLRLTCSCAPFPSFPPVQRLLNIAKEMGFVKLATTGLMARCVMIGTLTAGQFGIFDTCVHAWMRHLLLPKQQ